MQQLIGLIGVEADSGKAQEILAPLSCAFRTEEPLEEGDLPEHYLISAQNGIQLRLDRNERIAVIFLYGQPKDGFEPYKGGLVSSLSFSSNQRDIQSALGSPSAVGKPGKSLLGSHGGWIRYDYSDYSIHFSFGVQGGTIDLVTIMSADSVPK